MRQVTIHRGRRTLLAVVGLGVAMSALAGSPAVAKDSRATAALQAALRETGSNGPIDQGVYGYVTLREGDCMPVIEPGERSCRETPVSRTVYAYRPIHHSEMDGTYYRGSRRPVARTVSNTDGYYSLALPPGDYSLLADDGAPYCNLTDGQFACPVHVKRTVATRYDIVIDHATY